MQRRTLLKILGAIGLPMPAAAASNWDTLLPSVDPLQELANCVKAVEEIKDGIIDMAVAELNALGLDCRFSKHDVLSSRTVWRCAVGRPATELYANLTRHHPMHEDGTAQLLLDSAKSTLAVRVFSPELPDGFRRGKWERDRFDPFKLHRT